MKFLTNIFISLALVAFTACEGEKEYPWNPDWNQNAPAPEQPENPQQPENPEQPEVKCFWVL